MDLVDHFRELHRGDDLLVVPNPWDAGSARVLAHLGFRALATTSGGAAAARGRHDGQLDLATALDDAATIADAVDVPVTADLENGFADDLDGLAATVRRAAGAGLAGLSIEDWSGTAIYERDRAADRVAAAVEAAAGRVVVTARAENHFRGRDDLDDTVDRLVAYQRAGADVVYAPALRTAEQIRAVVDAVEVPVNVVAVRGLPPVAELRELGVRRLTVGASLAFHAYGALADAASELLATGAYDFLDGAARGRAVTRDAFG